MKVYHGAESSGYRVKLVDQSRKSAKKSRQKTGKDSPPEGGDYKTIIYADGNQTKATSTRTIVYYPLDFLANIVNSKEAEESRRKERIQQN